jgi:hypothetical protein
LKVSRSTIAAASRGSVKVWPHSEKGAAERWIRTLKDQCLWVQLHGTVDELRQAVASFVDRYNTSWLIQRHGHRTPKEAYQVAQAASVA